MSDTSVLPAGARPRRWLFLVLLAALATAPVLGCTESHSPPAEPDAPSLASDAGPLPVDAGPSLADAGPPDDALASVDSATADGWWDDGDAGEPDAYPWGLRG
jgi:hypothetical protein